MCQTEVHTEEGVMHHIEKSCVVPYECKPGCKDGICTYCCDTNNCNEPEDGPIDGACNLLMVTGCLFELTEVFLETDKIECSLVEEKAACVKYTREECEENGNTEVAETLSGFLDSETVATCQVELTDSQCGLYAVSGLASLLISNIHPDPDDLCILLSDVETVIAAAEENENCGEEEVKGVVKSFELLRSQLWSLDCSPTLRPQPRCDPIKAVQDCVPTSSEDCALEEKQACISNLTEGCQPVQQIFAHLALNIGAKYYCSEDSLDIPEPPSDLHPLSQCLQTFSNTFDAGLLDPSMLSNPVDQLVLCLLTSWNVDFIVTQPPVYKMYITEVFLFIHDVLLPAVTPEEDDGPLTGSEQCEASLREVSYGFSQQVMMMMLRPFEPLSDGFCIESRKLEVNIKAHLFSCTEEEKKYQLRLFMKLHAHRLSLCPDTEPLPYCSVEMASQCMTRFTAFMEINRDEDGVDTICGALSDSLTCVEAFTSTCDASQTAEVNWAVYWTVSTYWSVCPEVVSELVCGAEEVDEVEEVTVNCEDQSTALEACPTPILNCASINRTLTCYREAVGTCDNQETYQQYFNNAFPAHNAFAKAYCGLDLNTWSISGDGCAAPVCDWDAAATCLVLSDLTNNETAHEKAPGRIASAAVCLKDNLSGCDITFRAYTIHMMKINFTRLIHFFPSLEYLPLDDLEVEFPDPLGEWVTALVHFAEVLDHAFYSPEWDLLPLCWWLYDFRHFQTKAIGENSFQTELFSRSSYGIQKALDGICNDPDCIGVILQLPDINDEHNACPISNFMDNAAKSLFEAIFTPILQTESRWHLCKKLEEEYDLSACSEGWKHQMNLLIAIFKGVSGQVCSEKARYCSVKQVQKCAQQVATTFSRLGSTTSTEQVYSSINILDVCINQYSFKCDENSLKQIKMSTGSVRQLAVTACAKIVPDDPKPICTKPLDSACETKKERSCSFNQLFDLLNLFSNRDSHCRKLHYTHNCYKHVNETCSDEDAIFQSMYGLPLPRLAALWECGDDVWDDFKPAVCSEHCDFREAEQCITDLSITLRYSKGRACSEVTEARKCLLDKIGECKMSDQEYFHNYLKSVLDLHKSRTSHCMDVYTCLHTLSTITRQIFSLEDAPKPTSDSKDSDSKSKGSDKSDTKSKDSDTKSKDSDTKSKDSDTKSKDSDTKSKDSDTKSKDSDTKSKDSDTKSKDSDTKSKDSDTKSKDSDTKSKDSDTKSKDSDTKSKDSDTKSKDSDTKSKDSDTKSKDSDTKSKDSDTKSKDSDTKSKDSDTKSKDSDTKSKDSDTKSKDSDKSGTKDEDSSKSEAEKKDGDSSLAYLCQRAYQSWECAVSQLHTLPETPRMVEYILGPLWRVISERCANTVQLECYKCSNVPLHKLLVGNGVCEDETERCDHNERCSTQYTKENNNVLVTRGCMKSAECSAKDEQNMNIICCDGDLCNAHTDMDAEPDMENMCYVEHAVDCAFTFIGKLVTQGSVECSSSMQKLECVYEFTEYCPVAQKLHMAAKKMILALAMTQCVPGDLSEECSSIPVSSLHAVLSNAYSEKFICRGLNASKASLKHQEHNGQCTASDLAVLWDAMHSVSSIAQEFCYPDECPSSPAPAPPEKPKMEKKQDCPYLDTSLCGRSAVAELQDENPTCSALEEDAMCAVTGLKGCDVPPCLQGLIDEVKQSAKEKCNLDFSDPHTDDDTEDSQDEEQEECQPSVCNITAAMDCENILEASVNESDRCMKLKETAVCVGSNINGCHSVVSTGTVMLTLDDASKECNESVLTYLKVGDNEQKKTAQCFTYLMDREPLQNGAFADSFCSATAAFLECEKGGSKFTESYDLAAMLYTAEELHAVCNNESQDDHQDERRKRDADCSFQKTNDAIDYILFMPNWFNKINQQDVVCQLVNKAVDQIHGFLSEDCSHLGLNDFTLALLRKVESKGYYWLYKYCPPLLYEDSGCKPHLFSSCMEPFTALASFSKTEPDSMCRATEQSLENLKKFSKGCTESQNALVRRVRQQVMGVVGNSCPRLTLGLFCPDTYPNITNKYHCDPDKAKSCLPEDDATNWVKPTYCSDLEGNLTCARRSVEGCLLSDIKEVQEAINIDKMSNDIQLCHQMQYSIETSVIDYSSVCTAREPCSLRAALTCWHLQDIDPTDCQVLGEVRSCIDKSLGSCATDMEAVAIAHRLFSLGFYPEGSNCTAPFQELVPTFSQDNNCMEDFVDQFMSVFQSDRSVVGVCNAFEEYKACLKNAAQDITLLASVLKPDYGFVDEMSNLFCQPGSDSVNASTAEVSQQCNLHAASFCLVQDIVWFFRRHLLPNSDSHHFCSEWHRQEIRTCVEKATVECSAPVQLLYNAVVEMHNRLVLASRVCDALKVCYLEEAYYNINKFSVAISIFTVDEDTAKLCLLKQVTEIQVASFSGTCNQFEKEIVTSSLAKVEHLIEGVCEDVELPPPPICSDMPLEHRQCSIGAAFTCVIHMNMKLLDQVTQAIFIQGKPIFEWHWQPWCTFLESTMQCAAFNTSGCDRDDKDLEDVMTALEALRKQAGNNCYWLSDDLCSPTPRCRAQDVRCDLVLQNRLWENPLEDICEFITEAYQCVESNTITCTAAQKEITKKTIKMKLQQLSVPDLKCDGTEMAPCLLRARAASWNVLTNGTDACSTLTEAANCLNDSMTLMPESPTLQQQTVKAMFEDLKAIVDGWCNNPGTPACATPLAQVINTMYDKTVSLTVKNYDEAEICSVRQSLLAEITRVRQTCDGVDLATIEATLSTGVFSPCTTDLGVYCVNAENAAERCFSSFNASAEDKCSELESLWRCIAPVAELCNFASFNETYAELHGASNCILPPVIGLSTPTNRPLYLSERIGYAEITFTFIDSISVNYKVQIRAQISNKDPDTCFSKDSEEISQLLVLDTGDSRCGFEQLANEGQGQQRTIQLVATLDGQQDGLQQAEVSLYADIYQKDGESWSMYKEPFLIAVYEVNIEDGDAYAVCCAGRTYVETFDKTVFSNYYEEGQFVLYRNTFIASEVTVNYVSNMLDIKVICTVSVSTLSNSVEFNICDGDQKPTDSIDASMSGNGLELMVYRHSDLQTYYVVLPTGAIVKVKATYKKGLVVWVSASSLDFGKTEGLCGLYDQKGYNDLKLPGGNSYTLQEGEMDYGVISPQEFIKAWAWSSGSLLGEEATPSCSCLDSTPSDDDQCSALSRVATCDLVEGEDITMKLAAIPDEPAKKRKRRAVESAADATINFRQNASWPTPSNWTEDKAREHCESVLERKPALRYCAQAILLANGTDTFDRIINTCVDNIRLTDSTSNGNFTVIQAMENCRSLFLHNTTYQKNEEVRAAVLLFFEHSCVDDCSGNGDCKMGVCHCYPGFVGGNCSYQRTSLPRPFDTDIIKNGLCEVSERGQCDDVFITGQGFVESPYLSCHVQSVKVMSSGFHAPDGLPTKMAAILVTGTMALCPIRRSDDAQQTLLVAVSNDGINPTPAMLYTAYDPRCYACDPYSHQCTHIKEMKTCEIGGRCYMPEEMSTDNRCLFCDPLKSVTKWSIRDIPQCEPYHDSSEEVDEEDVSEVSPVLIAILSVGAALLVVAIIGIVICAFKFRRGRPSTRDQEFGTSPPSYDNPGYTDPQEVFKHHSIHKRIVTRESPCVAPTTQPDGENVE